MLLQRLKQLNIRHHPRRLFFPPEWIVLGVNNVCNLHCKMCDVGTGYEASNFFVNLMGSRPLNMPLELIRRIIDQTARFFPRAKLGYAFTEPLIYPHLVESLAYAQERNLYTSVTTNALTLEKKASELVRTGLNDLFVSLDGPPEIHNHVRGNLRSFQNAMAGMEKIFSMPEPRPDVSVYCTITEWNVGHLVEFVEYFRDLPIRQMGFMHTNYTPDHVAELHNQVYGHSYPATASNMKEIALDTMDLVALLEETRRIRASEQPFPISFSPELNRREELEVFYRQPERLIGRICNDAFRTIMIKSDGSAIPAHGRCYNIDAGNLYEHSLERIWNSSVLARFRETLIGAGGLLPACSRCCSAFKT